MTQRTARHDPGAKSEDEDTYQPARKPEHQQRGKPRPTAEQSDGIGDIGPDEPDDGEFELIGGDDLGTVDLGPAAPNFRDPDAGSGRARK